MPQLNPAPWLFTFLIVWIVTFTLLKLMLRLQNPTPPSKCTILHPSNPWTWMWL